MEYDYEVIYHPANTMKDVEAFTRRFGKAVATYLTQAVDTKHRNMIARPSAYCFDYLTKSPKSQQILPSISVSSVSSTPLIPESSIFFIHKVPNTSASTTNSSSSQ